MPDIDLDFPRDIREKLIVRVTERYGREHAALVASFATYRSRGAIRDVGKALGLPYAELERLARVSDGWNAERVAEEVAALPDGERKLLSKRWRAFAVPHARDRGAAAARLAAPGRDDRLDAAARRARPRAAGGDGRPPALPVGQGLVLRRGLPQDRPARARDALGGRGLRRPDRAPPRRSRSTSRGSRSTTPRSTTRSSGRHGRACSRSRAARRCRASCARGRRPSTTSRSRSRSSGPGRSRGRPCTRTSSTAAGCARTRRSSSRSTTSRCASRCLDARRRRLPGPGARGRDRARGLHDRRGRGAAPRDEPQAEPRRARGVPRRTSSRARSAKGVAEEIADGVFDKLVGFSGFGFPKAHAAAFGLLAYQSAWLRHHYPAEFLCALLNEQPMGFYPPATLVRDAQRRGVEVRPPTST